MTMTMHEIKDYGPEFLYGLLSRMKSDCLYYLGYGGRNAKHLWALDERKHIDTMRNIYRHLCEIGGAPEWISAEEIETYAEQMAA